MTVILQRDGRCYDVSLRRSARLRRRWLVEVAYFQIGGDARGFRVGRYRSFWRALCRYVWMILHPDCQFGRSGRNRRLRLRGWMGTHR
jgi:hypothetical protein